jgi:hypothetical protein
MTDAAPTCLLTATELAAMPEVHVRHPFNPASDVYLRSLGRPVGLKRLSLSPGGARPGLAPRSGMLSNKGLRSGTIKDQTYHRYC